MLENNFEDFENKPHDESEDKVETPENSDVDAETSSSSDGNSEEQTENAKSEEANPIGSDIIRGHINTIILRALYEGDKYGYEIMNDIELKSHGQYSLKQPTLYSALKRLENQGYIKAYWKTDEVSSGGRRKYFKLTESGKEITEKNLAEWEYSRTIIDRLISDRSFDFSNPAPTPVDFHILKNSVSRVPVVKYEESEKDEKSDSVTNTTVNEYKEQINYTEPAPQQIIVEQPIVQQIIVEKPVVEQNEVQAYPQQQQYSTPEQAISEPPAPTTVRTVEDSALAESRRIAHENYLRLISEPVRVQEPVRDNVVPNSEKLETDSLIYNNRPETERDYKNLIDGIFRKAVANGSVQTSYARVDKPKRTTAEEPRNLRLIDRGKADGVSVSTSTNFDVNSTYATKTTYNKGLNLLKCAAIVLAICVIEFIFCFIFLKQLSTTWVYPTVILLLGLVQFTVFGVMVLQGYGKNCVRPTTNSYISTCVILTIIAVLIISALSFLLNVNPNSVSDVMKMIVIPSITALNITVFAVCFKAFLR
ncbi:MAG: helix-turn-helix transcriptional regulator [Clostridia bacterium]|nr:helix-turn-helix transcriptional regulator [Clostridia bacterium]